MKKLYKYKKEFRYGTIESVFVEHDYEIIKRIGDTIYFGSIFGKHSDVEVELDIEDLTIISTDAEVIDKMQDLFDCETMCGKNPINILRDEEY